jgi:hypothetical protein
MFSSYVVPLAASSVQFVPKNEARPSLCQRLGGVNECSCNVLGWMWVIVTPHSGPQLACRHVSRACMTCARLCRYLENVSLTDMREFLSVHRPPSASQPLMPSDAPFTLPPLQVGCDGAESLLAFHVFFCGLSSPSSSHYTLFFLLGLYYSVGHEPHIQ